MIRYSHIRYVGLFHFLNQMKRLYAIAKYHTRSPGLKARQLLGVHIEGGGDLKTAMTTPNI